MSSNSVSLLLAEKAAKTSATAVLKGFFVMSVVVFIVMFLESVSLIIIGTGGSILTNWADGIGGVGMAIAVIFLGFAVGAWYLLKNIKPSQQSQVMGEALAMVGAKAAAPVKPPVKPQKTDDTDSGGNSSDESETETEEKTGL